jgi:hypothetical protein
MLFRWCFHVNWKILLFRRALLSSAPASPSAGKCSLRVHMSCMVLDENSELWVCLTVVLLLFLVNCWSEVNDLWVVVELFPRMCCAHAVGYKVTSAAAQIAAFLPSLAPLQPPCLRRYPVRILPVTTCTANKTNNVHIFHISKSLPRGLVAISACCFLAHLVLSTPLRRQVLPY